MNEKIFAKLKQVYSPLGLGDGILRAHAESLANLGFVTDENVDEIVNKQEAYLKGLQKYNDERVNSAVKTAKENARKEYDEETKKKAEEEAKKKEAEEAKRAAEEASKNTDIPDWYKQVQEANAKAQEQQRKDYLAQIEKLTKANADMQTRMDEVAKKEATRKRSDFILSKAKELGIPQYRIDEGFVIGDDADNDSITNILTGISKNIKANSLPQSQRFQMGDEKAVSSEEVKEIAKNIVH